MAVDQEIERQVGILESGGRVMQETRLFNPDTGETVSMRSKEHAHDYRYFPEPDLVPLRVSEDVAERYPRARCRSFRRRGARGLSNRSDCANTTRRC